MVRRDSSLVSALSERTASKNSKRVDSTNSNEYEFIEHEYIEEEKTPNNEELLDRKSYGEMRVNSGD